MMERSNLDPSPCFLSGCFTRSFCIPQKCGCSPWQCKLSCLKALGDPRHSLNVSCDHTFDDGMHCFHQTSGASLVTGRTFARKGIAGDRSRQSFGS